MPPELKVLIMSAMPIVEMKGGIPYGVTLGLSVIESTLFAIIGTSLQIPLNIWLVEWLSRIAHRNPHAHRFMSWSRRRSERHQVMIRRWGLVGITVLVGIPIPGTGLWTGAVVGTLMGLSRGQLVIGLILGSIMAGILIGLATAGVTRLFPF